MTSSTPTKNTNAFFLQAGVSFAVALLTMIFAIFYLPVDPWIRAFLGLGTMFLTTSSFTLAKCTVGNEAVQGVGCSRGCCGERTGRGLAVGDRTAGRTSPELVSSSLDGLPRLGAA